MQENVLINLEPKKVFYFFEQISKIPRGSGNTKQISDYLVNFAKERNLDFYQDDLNNVIIYKYLDNCKGNYKGNDLDDSGVGDVCLDGSTVNYVSLGDSSINDDIVILQGHIDMVCDKSPKSSKDMGLEGLDLEVNGDYISAKDTSLGADNGIAIAMTLAILDDDSLKVPSIEAVFTSDEEIGFVGAEGLDFSKLKGKLLINIDSEDEGVVVVSCAGGNHLNIAIPTVYDTISINKLLNQGYNLIKISIGGLKGGHSGLEIDKCLANANKILGELLYLLNSKADIKLIGLNGGNLANAIPKSANVTIIGNLDEIKQIINGFELDINQRFAKIEDKISINIISDLDINLFNNVVSEDSVNKIISFLNKVPNGLYKMSEDFNGLVETSLNLGVVSLDNSNNFNSLDDSNKSNLLNNPNYPNYSNYSSSNDFKAVISFRSSKDDEKIKLNNEVISLVEELCGTAIVDGDYSSWNYKKESRLREIVVNEYEKLYEHPMEIGMIHAGLECGLFSKKIEGLDAVSIGPNLENVHSFNEKMSISSVLRTYNLLLNILKELS